jgi:methylamine dehydrogenase accessory protein MauD
MMTLSISLWLLWGVVIVLALTVLALARQVGVLHERVAPAGALLSGAGPGVGEASPRLEVHALAGNAITVGGRLAAGRALLMLFVSHTCPICKKLIPVAQDFTKTERLEVLYVGDGELVEQNQLIAKFAIDSRRFVNGPEIGLAYRVDKLPYAVLLDEEGLISAKGLVNSREHLESLIIAKESGFATLQSYLMAQPEVAR